MKIKNKRPAAALLAAVLASSLLPMGTAAQEGTLVTPDTMPDIKLTEPEKKDCPAEESTAVDTLRYDPQDAYPVYAGYEPNYRTRYNSNIYELFDSMAELYTDTHLYDFSKEQLTEAFIMKLLTENPELFGMFADTLLGTMDEYSALYMSDSQFVTGESGGYGFSLGDETDYEIRKLGLAQPGVYVTSVLYNSGALAAGLRVGDRIVGVEEFTVENLPVDAVMDYVRGLPYVEKEAFDEEGNSLGIPNEPEFILNDKGRKIYPLHLTVERDGEKIPFTLTRGTMIPYATRLYIPPDSAEYAYILISSFKSEFAADEFAGALSEVKRRGIRKLLLDVRGNGGGYLEAALRMANMLIPEKDRILYYTNDNSGDPPAPVYSDGGGTAFENIVILCDGETASASELFAMTLKYNAGAILVGENTFGKGVGQDSYSLLTGDVFTITSFEILAPNKQSYNRIGLVPDVEVHNSLHRYEFPSYLPRFNFMNYLFLWEGVENETVLGLEQRLEMLGFMKEEYVDGVYDAETTNSVRAFQLYRSLTPTGVMDDEFVELLTGEINYLKNYYYYTDSQYDVGVMCFSSRSQGKRLAKELERDSQKVWDEKAAFEAAEREAEKAMEKAAREEEAAEAAAAAAAAAEAEAAGASEAAPTEG